MFMFVQHAAIWFLFLISLAFPPLFIVTLPFIVWRITRTVRLVQAHRLAQQQAAEHLWIAQLAAYTKGSVR